MGKDREFFALFIIFILIFSLLSMVTEQRLRALDLLPRFHDIAPQRDAGRAQEESQSINPAMRSPLLTPPVPVD